MAIDVVEIRAVRAQLKELGGKAEQLRRLL
jgi:hypothetical protein